MEKAIESQQRIRPSSSSKASDLEDNIRPFKKAKYAWQIKGRGCYNKAPMFYNNNNKSFSSNSSSFPVQIPDQNLERKFSSEKLSFPTIKKHFKIDQVEVININPNIEGFKNCDVIMSKDVQSEDLNFEPSKRNNEESDKKNETRCDSNKSEENKVDLNKALQVDKSSVHETNLISVSGSFSPAHMVAQCMDQFLCTLNRTNYSLRKWQTKQIAKGIIDNAINKVLEEMGFIPMPLDNMDAEVADTNVNADINCQNIENEGVSEAIRQQGLQRRTCCGQLSSKDILPKEAPSSSVSLPLAELNLSEIQTFHHPSAPCTCHVHNKQKDGSYHMQNCDKVLVSNYDKQKPKDDLTFTEETSAQEDVLNAAVSFAISEKGLGFLTDSETSYG